MVVVPQSNKREERKMNVAKKVLKIVLAVFLALIMLILLVWGGLNLFKPVIYSEFFSIDSVICKNPGLNDGFVCQGIAVDEQSGKVIVSGYMKDDSASRIYVTDKDNNVRYVTLSNGGKPFTGHMGGIAIGRDSVYFPSGSKLVVVPLADVLNENTKDIDIAGKTIAMMHSISCVFANEEYLYIGQFHDGGKYVIEGHEMETAEGTHYAFVTCYDLDDLTTPTHIYSVRDRVQGFCMTPDGQAVLSTSYGLTSSVYYVYDTNGLQVDTQFEGIDVYFLDHCQRQFSGPAMSEDLDYSNGLVVTFSESASDKYIFGKFFFADKVYGLDLNK